MHNQLHKFWPELINIFYYDWAFIEKLFPGFRLLQLKDAQGGNPGREYAASIRYLCRLVILFQPGPGHREPFLCPLYARTDLLADC
jgi:hypothetical protein